MGKKEQKEFGRLIRSGRVRAGHTVQSAVEALAEQGFKISRRSLSMYESGDGASEEKSLALIERFAKMGIGPTIEVEDGEIVHVTSKAMARFEELVEGINAGESLTEVRVRVVAFARELEESLASEEERKRWGELMSDLLTIQKRSK